MIENISAHLSLESSRSKLIVKTLSKPYLLERSGIAWNFRFELRLRVPILLLETDDA